MSLLGQHRFSAGAYAGVWDYGSYDKYPDFVHIDGPPEVMVRGLTELDWDALLGTIELATGVHVRLENVRLDVVTDVTYHDANYTAKRQAVEALLRTALFKLEPRKSFETQITILASAASTEPK